MIIWVYRFGGLKRGKGKKGRAKGPAPPSSSRLGARVAPQRCPILRAGRTGCISSCLIHKQRKPGGSTLNEPLFCLDEGVHLRGSRIDLPWSTRPPPYYPYETMRLCGVSSSSSYVKFGGAGVPHAGQRAKHQGAKSAVEGLVVLPLGKVSGFSTFGV